MKKIIFSAVLLLIFCATFAQKGPKITFSAVDQTIDFGKVSKETDSGKRIFEFTNTGDEPLIILSAKATCGCTVPSQPTEPILPGKTGQIEVQYSMNPGVFSKSVIVDCNAVNVPDGKIAIKIKGEVIVPVVVNPLEKTKSMVENRL